MSREAVIAVDFDGTLFDLGQDGHLHLIPGAKEALKDLRMQGHRIVIYTCRTGIAHKHGKLMQEVSFIKKILNSHDLEYDEIFMGEKIVADVYVDDRAVPFAGDWNEAFRKIEKHIDGMQDDDAI